MADGSTLPQSANITSAIIATEARRYWLGLVGKMVRYLFEPIDGEDAREELRMFLVIPSTPTSRARGERVKAAVLAAAAEHHEPTKDIAFNFPLIEAVIEAARTAIGRVTTARELAAAFGLDVRLYSWRGREQVRHVYETPTLQPSGAWCGARNDDAPTLSMATSVEMDDFVENVAWGVGSLVCHWLGVNPRASTTALVERQIGYALAVRPEDVIRPVLVDAWWVDELNADGEITDASYQEYDRAIEAECRIVADGISAIASAKMVRSVAWSYDSFEDARRIARLACDRAVASACTEIGEAA